MASGKIHGRVTVTLSPMAGLLSYLMSGDLYTGLLGLVGCLIGLFIEPDLDVNHTTSSERRLLRTFTPLGLIWIAIWNPYGKLIPHRHPVSHYPVISTIIRYIYLVAVLSIPFLLFAIITGVRISSIDIIYKYRYEMGWILFGNMISDIGHWVLDQ